MPQHDELLAYCCLDLVRRPRWVLALLAGLIWLTGGGKWPATQPTNANPASATQSQ